MIYIDVEFDPETETLESFIPKCLSSEEGWRFKPTFKDPELIVKQYRAANRSFAAILELCQTYFPGCTEREVAVALNNLCDKLRISDDHLMSTMLICLRCTDVNKIVFLGYPVGPDTSKRYKESNLPGMLKYSELAHQERYHIDWSDKLADKYTWKYLKNLIEQEDALHQGTAAN